MDNIDLLILRFFNPLSFQNYVTEYFFAWLVVWKNFFYLKQKNIEGGFQRKEGKQLNAHFTLICF